MRGPNLIEISKNVATNAAEKLVLKFEDLIVVLLSGILVYKLDSPMLGVSEYRAKKDRSCRQWLRLGDSYYLTVNDSVVCTTRAFEPKLRLLP